MRRFLACETSPLIDAAARMRSRIDSLPRDACSTVLRAFGCDVRRPGVRYAENGLAVRYKARQRIALVVPVVKEMAISHASRMGGVVLGY